MLAVDGPFPLRAFHASCASSLPPFFLRVQDAEAALLLSPACARAHLARCRSLLALGRREAAREAAGEGLQRATKAGAEAGRAFADVVRWETPRWAEQGSSRLSMQTLLNRRGSFGAPARSSLSFAALSLSAVLLLFPCPHESSVKIRPMLALV